ncbi:MAG: N-acetylmuramoyl-L-alanine amidase [Candidatus Micrarchaeota archaeon]
MRFSLLATVLLTLAVFSAGVEVIQEQPAVVSFNSPKTTIQITPPNEAYGSLLYRVNDPFNCLEVTQTNSLTLETEVRPLCGVCSSQGLYEAELVYSFASYADVHHVKPLSIRCSADLVFLTDFSILGNDAQLETALTNWIGVLRSEGRGVWVIDLSSNDAMENLGLVSSSGIRLNEGGIKAIIDNVRSHAANNFLVIGGGTDVIPMPEITGWNKWFSVDPFEYELKPANDYCYTQTNYAGGECVPDITAQNGLVVSRMPTEKTSGGDPVNPRVLIKMLESSVSTREIPRSLNALGMHCGTQTPEEYLNGSHCDHREQFELLKTELGLSDAQAKISPPACYFEASGYANSTCDANALRSFLSSEGVIYVNAHGNGHEMTSTALLNNDTGALLDALGKYDLGHGVITRQIVANSSTMNSLALGNALHFYDSCWTGSADYDMNGNELNISNSVLMKALYNGLPAAMACTSVSSVNGEYAAFALGNFAKYATIGAAFNAFKSTESPVSFLDFYDRNCMQLYGDPTIRLTGTANFITSASIGDGGEPLACSIYGCPLDGKRIFIDIGHLGVSSESGYSTGAPGEVALNVEVAEKLKYALEEVGAEVKLFEQQPNSDNYMTERRSQANAFAPHLVLSIHHECDNTQTGCGSRSSHETIAIYPASTGSSCANCVFCAPGLRDARCASSKRAAETIRDELVEVSYDLTGSFCERAPSEGLWPDSCTGAGMVGSLYSNAPSVVIEVTNVNNPVLSSGEKEIFQDEVVYAITDGVVNYFQEP